MDNAQPPDGTKTPGPLGQSGQGDPPLLPRTPPPRQKQRSTGWIVGGTAFILAMLVVTFLCGACFLFSLVLGRGTFAGDVVAVIQVEGVITSSGGGDGMFDWGCSAESLVEQLHQARMNDRIKAILIRIDSPGGTPAAAKEVYTEIRRTVAEKPVVVSIGDMGASAAYFIASATDVIFASPDSSVGGIGVIVQIPNIEELSRKIGVEYTILTEGEYKDIGSPHRSVTPQETAIITGQMKVAYDNLIKGIAEGRDMDEARIRELATGLTWPGVQARDLGLIDELGNFRDAVEKAGRMGGIEGDVNIIYMSRESPFSILSELIRAVRELARTADVLRGNGGATGSRPIKW